MRREDSSAGSTATGYASTSNRGCHPDGRIAAGVITAPIPGTPQIHWRLCAGSLPNQARQNNDVTVVEVYEPPPRMVVRAKGWPIGEARVTIDVKPRGRASMARIQ